MSESVDFKQSNCTLRGYPARRPGEIDVSDLRSYQGDKYHLSCWRLSWRERFFVALTGRCWLWVWTFKKKHPPVCVTGDYPFNRRSVELFKSLRRGVTCKFQSYSKSGRRLMGALRTRLETVSRLWV